MRSRLLALALITSGVGAGVALFVNFNTGTVDRQLADVGAWEALDRESCTMRACAAQQCVVAGNILADAGSSCSPRFFACDFRIGQRIRNLASDAGVALGPQKYQRLELIALRCPAVDGGFAFGVPFEDNGWPTYAVSVVAPRCVRAPFDGGTLCRRTERDGGFRYYGAGNAMLSTESNAHATCEPCGCTVVYGDNPDTDL